MLPPIRALLLVLCVAACAPSSPPAPARSSAYPLPVAPNLVGSYAQACKSGGGYFYDELLEYRVWVHPESGGSDEMRAFGTFEEALEFGKRTRGAEPPLVLVRQREWIDEPSKNVFVRKTGERVAEWQVAWLARGPRQPGDIEKFLREHGK